MKHVITQTDPIYYEVSRETANLIKPILSYTAVFYKQGYYRKERKEYQKSTILKVENRFYFLSGFLDRVLTHLGENNVTLTTGEGFPAYKSHAPDPFFEIVRKTIPNCNEKQIEAAIKMINSARIKGRGVIQAPTGVGKTIIGIGLLSCFNNLSLLWLCHTKDLMMQTIKEFKRFGFKSVGMIGDSACEVDKQVTVATRQSFVKLVDDLGDNYDMIIVDEVHHVSGFNTDYFTILTNTVAPLRFGLTATLPDKEESKLACEGLIGPVVASLSINEGNAIGIIAKPIIRLLRVLKNHSVGEIRKYADVYDAGVVHNLTKNRLIIDTAKKHVDKGDSVLILLTRIEHGQNLVAIAREIGFPIEFVQGSTEGEVRMQIKEALNTKKIKCVIATVVFFEGVNIPELDVIINAAGGKSEIRTLQILGRGLRKTKTKDTVIIYDIFDPSHKYLLEHWGERVCVYFDQGWLGSE